MEILHTVGTDGIAILTTPVTFFGGGKELNRPWRVERVVFPLIVSFFLIVADVSGSSSSLLLS